MKQVYVTDLQDGQLVLSLFLVREKEIRTSQRTGTSWLHLDLVDRTGTICAKMWENFSALAETFERDDVIHIRGRVKVYKGEKEIALEQLKPALPAEFDLADFLPHTRHDVGQVFAELRYAIAAMKNPWLRQLLTSVVEDPIIEPKLKRAPAAVTMHHAFIGGLLEHIHSLIGLGRAVASHYPELDPDLLLAGIVLHDIGKTEELTYVRGVEYTTEGRLLGHIMIGVTLVREKIRAIPGFPAPLATLVEHMILSHHGTHEFGSPSLPQTREAVALHFLDDMDSKMAAIRASLEAAASQPASELWTDRNPSLRRALLRSDVFLSPPPANEAAPAAPPKKVASPVAAPTPAQGTLQVTLQQSVQIPVPATAVPKAPKPAAPSMATAPPQTTPSPVAQPLAATPPLPQTAPVQAEPEPANVPDDDPVVTPAVPVATPGGGPGGSVYASLFSKSESDGKGKFEGAAIAIPDDDAPIAKTPSSAAEKPGAGGSRSSSLFRTFTADEPEKKSKDKSDEKK